MYYHCLINLLMQVVGILMIILEGRLYFLFAGLVKAVVNSFYDGLSGISSLCLFFSILMC